MNSFVFPSYIFVLLTLMLRSYHPTRRFISNGRQNGEQKVEKEENATVAKDVVVDGREKLKNKNKNASTDTEQRQLPNATDWVCERVDHDCVKIIHVAQAPRTEANQPPRQARPSLR